MAVRLDDVERAVRHVQHARYEIAIALRRVTEPEGFERRPLLRVLQWKLEVATRWATSAHDALGLKAASGRDGKP